MSKVVCSPARTVRFVLSLITMLIAVFGPAAAASAQTTITLSTPGTQINADLMIQGGAYGYTDFSNDAVMATKVSSDASYARRILMKFDTQNLIPANSVIQSARLELVLQQAENSESRPLTIYHVTKSFVRWEANWYYYRSGQPWSAPGGDLGPSFGTAYVGANVGAVYTFDLTDLV